MIAELVILLNSSSETNGGGFAVDVFDNIKPELFTFALASFIISLKETKSFTKLILGKWDEKHHKLITLLTQEDDE